MTWPDGMEMIRQLREAVGLFSGAMPITPEEAWEEALDKVRSLAITHKHRYPQEAP